MRKLINPGVLNIFSQLFTNLAAGWFGVVFIIPGITGLESLTDILWLIKNFLLGILALWISIIIHKGVRYES